MRQYKEALRQILFLLLGLLFVAPAELFAVPDVSLSANLAKKGKVLRLNFTPSSSAEACFYTLLASQKKAKLDRNDPQGVVLTILGGAAGDSNVNFNKITQRITKRKRNAHLRVKLSCVGESGFELSNVVTLTLPKSSVGEVTSTKGWINALRDRLLQPELKLIDRFSSLSFEQPVDLQSPKDNTNRLFVVEQSGAIKVFEAVPAASSAATFLNLASKIETGSSEQGLLGLAFHPDFATNRFFFVHYVEKDTDKIVIARYQVDSSTPNLADPSSEVVFLRVTHPFKNHNAGQLAFGPDGLLYIGMGDGGSAGDPQGNGQDKSTLLGKLLRIDVDSSSGSLNYSIPSTNPFFGNISGFKQEIFAVGLRNPWRFSFDIPTARIWLADVGQNELEEVNLIENGGNYGWNTTEGSACFNPSSGCDKSGLTAPLAEYNHSVGQSITGGYVYRGSSLPELFGTYLYGDFVTGVIFALKDDALSSPIVKQQFDTELNISSFGIDQSGELYVVSYSDGKLYHVTK